MKVMIQFCNALPCGMPGGEVGGGCANGDAAGCCGRLRGHDRAGEPNHSDQQRPCEMQGGLMGDGSELK